MNYLSDIDYLFYQNFSSVYEQIFLQLSSKNTILQQIAQNYSNLGVSLQTIADYNLILRSAFQLPVCEQKIEEYNFYQALQVISGKFYGALHNFMVFLEDTRELSFQQIINLDLITLLSYNLDFDIFYKALRSVGLLGYTFLVVANPLAFSNGFQIFSHQNLFFVWRTNDAAQRTQYLLNVQLVKGDISTGAYDYVFTVSDAIALVNAASPPEMSQNYSPFATVLAKSEQLKYADVLLSSNSHLLNLKISLQYSQFLESFSSSKVKLLQQAGKQYIALPYIFYAKLVNYRQIQEVCWPYEARINDLELDAAISQLPYAIEFREMLYDNQFSGLTLSNKMQSAENNACQLVEDADGDLGYFYLYFANYRLFAARAGQLVDLDINVRVQLVNRQFYFTMYECSAEQPCFQLSMDYFVEAYALFMAEKEVAEVSINAIQQMDTFECTIQQAFKYNFSQYYRILQLKIHGVDEQQNQLAFVPQIQEETPELVFFQSSEPLFTPPPQQAPWSFSPNSHFSQPFFSTNEFSQESIFSLQPTNYVAPQMTPQRQSRAKIQLSLISSTAEQEFSQLQQASQIDSKAFMIKDVYAYVRYHFPSYNIAIVAFYDPYHRDDQWIHSLAVWKLPVQLQTKIQRQQQTIFAQGKEDLYFSRAKIVCDVYPIEVNSGIYLVDSASFIDYIDPSTQCSKDQLVEGSVYWQEIDKEKKQDNTFGFVRLASGHERHFFCKRKASLLGHLVYISLQENKQHPNSCELLRSVQQPPDKQKWLYGRVIDIFQDIKPELENILKKSFRTTLSHPGGGRQLVNGMVMAEPFQGTHVDICFFRLVQPDFIVQQLKPGTAVYFTLKDQALHKVIDEARSYVPIELLNDLIQNKMLKKSYRIQQKDQGNSAKLSCWAVDNISICSEIYQGDFVTCAEKNCQGIRPENLFFMRYKQIIYYSRDSIIYVPRPILQGNVYQYLIKEDERFRFNVYFAFNDQKSAFLPEASQICRIQQDVFCQKIYGRIRKIKYQRQFLYIFKPDGCDSSLDDVSQCISDQIIPLSNCFFVKSSCFYLLQNEIINLLYKNSQQRKIRQFFNDLVNGQISVMLKSVSLGLSSTVGLDEVQRFRQLEWCRYADELMIKSDLISRVAEELPQTDASGSAEDDFLKY